jgi:prepilin-type N-terminal cleavage/methylation domain-containing protein
MSATFAGLKEAKGMSHCGMRIADCGIKSQKSVAALGRNFTPHSAFRIPQSGMTLIEVVVVMVIIGTFSAIVISSAGSSLSTGVSVTGAAHMIASDLRYAQESAMANGISKSVIFTSGASVYTFTPANALDGTGQLPSGVTIQNDFTVTFNSLGEPIAGGGGIITVSGGGQTQTISIVNYTGKVNIS